MAKFFILAAGELFQYLSVDAVQAIGTRSVGDKRKHWVFVTPEGQSYLGLEVDAASKADPVNPLRGTTIEIL
jgi:hypothetical protein